MATFKHMADYLTPCENDKFKLAVVDLNYRDNFLYLIRAGIREGKYVSLIDKESRKCIMSDTQLEQHTNRKFIDAAHGKVLIGGLGIGFVLMAIQDKPEVESILVVEKYQEVIDLVAPQLPLNSKVKIIVGDIYTYEPEAEYFNTVYLDIWNSIGSRDIYEDQKPLRARYRKALVPKSEDANRWINCWGYEYNRDENLNWGW